MEREHHYINVSYPTSSSPALSPGLISHLGNDVYKVRAFICGFHHE